MPGFDGRGPNGEGSMTGRGRGRCTDTFTEEKLPQANSPENSDVNSQWAGRGFFRRGMGGANFPRGCGRGMGRGFRRGFRR